MAKRNVEESTFNCPLCEDEVKESAKRCPNCGLFFPDYDEFSGALKFATEKYAKLFEKADKWGRGYCSKDANHFYERGRDESKGHDYSYTEATGDVYERRHWTDDGDLIISHEQKTRRISGHQDADWDRVYSDYLKAAEGGKTAAIRELGKLVCYGRGTDLDVEQGFVLICKAAAMGNAIARNWLLVGDGGLSDKENWLKAKHAHEILSYAAYDLDLNWAKYYLGNLYFYGAGGVKKDYAEAQKLFSAATIPEYHITQSNYVFANNYFDGGFDLAKQMRALCYFDGVGGVKQDVDLAIEYLNQISWNLKVYGARVSRCALKLLRRLDLWTCDELPDSLVGKENVRILEGLDNSSYWDLDQFKALVVEAAKQYKSKHACDWISIAGEDALATKAIGKFSAENKGLDGWIFVGRRPDKGILLGTRYHLFDIRTKEGGAGITGVSFLCCPFFEEEKGVRYHNDCKRVMNLSTDGIGVSTREIVEFLNYVRRYVLLDRKERVELADGTLQGAKQVQKPENQSPIFGIMSRTNAYDRNWGRAVHWITNATTIGPLGWGAFMSKETKETFEEAQWAWAVGYCPYDQFSANDWYEFLDAYNFKGAGGVPGVFVKKVDWLGVNNLDVEKKVKLVLGKSCLFGERIQFTKSEMEGDVVKALSPDEMARLCNMSPSAREFFNEGTFDWNGLSAEGWVNLLWELPQYKGKCDVTKVDWSVLGRKFMLKALSFCPEGIVAYYNDWESVSHDEWVELVKHQPILKSYMKKYDKGKKDAKGDEDDKEENDGCQLGCLGTLFKLIFWCAVIWYGLSVGVSFVDYSKFEVPEKARGVLNQMSNDGMKVREWVLGLIVKAQEAKEDKSEN